MKFSCTNQKHFTVGDPTAFPIVTLGNKTPKTSPSPCMTWTHLIQQCLGPPHTPPQTAGPTLRHCRTMVTMARPKCGPESTPSSGQIANTCLIRGPVRPMVPNGCRMRSVVYPQCTRQTDRPTDRSYTGKFDDYRPLRSESDAA